MRMTLLTALYYFEHHYNVFMACRKFQSFPVSYDLLRRPSFTLMTLDSHDSHDFTLMTVQSHDYSLSWLFSLMTLRCHDSSLSWLLSRDSLVSWLFVLMTLLSHDSWLSWLFTLMTLRCHDYSLSWLSSTLSTVQTISEKDPTNDFWSVHVSSQMSNWKLSSSARGDLLSSGFHLEKMWTQCVRLTCVPLTSTENALGTTLRHKQLKKCYHVSFSCTLIGGPFRWPSFS